MASIARDEQHPDESIAPLAGPERLRGLLAMLVEVDLAFAVRLGPYGHGDRARFRAPGNERLEVNG
jgi:hypothetical protein